MSQTDNNMSSARSQWETTSLEMGGINAQIISRNIIAFDSTVSSMACTTIHRLVRNPDFLEAGRHVVSMSVTARWVNVREDLRGNETRVYKAQPSLMRLVDRLPGGFGVVSPACEIFWHFFLVREAIVVGLLSASDTFQRDECHEWFICSAVDVSSPDCGEEQRHDGSAAIGCVFESQLPANGELEQDQANQDSVAHHDPASACRVLFVVHCVEQLIFVDKSTDQKVGQSRQEDFPRVSEDTVDQADNEDEKRLWQIESIAENGWLHKLGIV